jgi:hypothetical protein
LGFKHQILSAFIPSKKDFQDFVRAFRDFRGQKKIFKVCFSVCCLMGWCFGDIV